MGYELIYYIFIRICWKKCTEKLNLVQKIGPYFLLVVKMRLISKADRFLKAGKQEFRVVAKSQNLIRGESASDTNVAVVASVCVCLCLCVCVCAL